MRKIAKIDDSQKSIVTALRTLGLTVQSLAQLGSGCPDILVGVSGVNFLFEIKDGKKPPCKRKLTEDEVHWHRMWRGQVNLAESVEDVMAVVNEYFRKLPTRVL